MLSKLLPLVLISLSLSLSLSLISRVSAVEMKSIVISGQTAKEATVFVNINGNDEITASDEAGFFQKELVNITTGDNFIEIYSEKEGLVSNKRAYIIPFSPDANAITLSDIFLEIPGKTVPVLPTKFCVKNNGTADLNEDGKVNLTDFSIMLSYWDSDKSCPDLNNDGSVNFSDLIILLQNWGIIYPPLEL